MFTRGGKKVDAIVNKVQLHPLLIHLDLEVLEQAKQLLFCNVYTLPALRPEQSSAPDSSSKCPLFGNNKLLARADQYNVQLQVHALCNHFTLPQVLCIFRFAPERAVFQSHEITVANKSCHPFWRMSPAIGHHYSCHWFTRKLKRERKMASWWCVKCFL